MSWVLHGLAFHPHDPERGNASATWRQGHGGQPEEDVPGVTTREFSFSGERTPFGYQQRHVLIRENRT